MAEALKFLSDPVYSALISAAAAIGLSAMARKGIKIPFLYDLLNYLIGRAPAPFLPPPVPPPVPVPAPVVPATAPALTPEQLAQILEALKSRG